MHKTGWLTLLCALLASWSTARSQEADAGTAAREAMAAQSAAEAQAERIPVVEAQRQTAQIAGEVATLATLSIMGAVNDPRLAPELRKRSLEAIRAFLAERSKPCGEVLAVQRSEDARVSEILCAGGATYTVDMKTGQIL